MPPYTWPSQWLTPSAFNYFNYFSVCIPRKMHATPLPLWVMGRRRLTMQITCILARTMVNNTQHTTDSWPIYHCQWTNMLLTVDHNVMDEVSTEYQPAYRPSVKQHTNQVSANSGNWRSTKLKNTATDAWPSGDWHIDINMSIEYWPMYQLTF